MSSGPLSIEDLDRYARQLVLPEFGAAGQAALGGASVLVVGAGALGGPVALYLAAAGVGRLGIADGDRVAVSNLQRQVLHFTPDVGVQKAHSAAAKLRFLNPGIIVEPYPADLDAGNARAMVAGQDVVVDCSDTFATRALVNAACCAEGVALVEGGAVGLEGLVLTVQPGESACYRCAFPADPSGPSCAEAGVLGPVAGIVGSIQAIETIKLILGEGTSLIGRLLLFDALSMKFREMKLRKNPDCVLCGSNPSVTELVDYQAFCGIKPAPSADEVAAVEKLRGRDWEMSPLDLKVAFDTSEPLFLLDVREPHEVEICSIPGTDAVIPVGALADRVGEILTDKPIVVYCRSGVRSARAFDTLRAAGFQSVRNLRGGILAWSRDVDPLVPQY